MADDWEVGTDVGAKEGVGTTPSVSGLSSDDGATSVSTLRASIPSALKPCPFCGGKASVQHWSWPYPRWRVLCSACKCQASGRRADPSDAIAAWEARIGDADPVTVPLDAAAALVPEGFNFGVGHDALGDGGPGGWAWVSNQDSFEIVRADSPASALCAAIAKAEGR